MSQCIHIVCLDAPSPPNYGGAIDMYYKIKALASVGKKIILHYFDYRPGRGAAGLEKDCVAVHAYKRKPAYESLPLRQPFIVKSRINHDLVKRLSEDSHPILLEGLHCAGIIPFLNPERIVLRMHNEEARYYRHLAQSETSFIKRLYFNQESRLLHRYQQRMNKKLKLVCLSETDAQTFKEEYGFQNVSLLPCFIPWQTIGTKEGRGNYCLYHGNLNVSENEEAALWLVRTVFSKIDVPFIIAGSGVSARLQQEAASYKNISLLNQPSIAAIDELIQNAQINVLPSLNATGVKLKLLNALLNGRHCITNIAGVAGSKIESGLVVEDDAEKWMEKISHLMTKSFDAGQKASRQPILTLYNNRRNAELLSEQW